MPMYFGDLGKSAKDILTGGYQYDHKGSYAMKTDSGVTLTVNGKKKGDAVSADLKASTKVNGVTVDAGLSGGKLETTVTMDEVTPGLKAALSASLPEPDSGKLALTYSAINDMGLKCDVGLKSGAKFNANACMVKGPLALGGALCLDTGAGKLSKFELGAQYDVTPASTFTGMLLDSGSDLKFSYFYKMKADLSVGAECKYSIAKGTAAYTAGCAKKLDGGAAAKAVLTDAGIVSLQYSQDLRPKTTGVFSCQFDLKSMDKGAKAGMELKVKA